MIFCASRVCIIGPRNFKLTVPSEYSARLNIAEISGGRTLILSHRSHNLSHACSNMNRGKNQNGGGPALTASPQHSPWVLRYAEHNARFPSETILIRMRVGGSDESAMVWRPARKIYFLITELFT